MLNRIGLVLSLVVLCSFGCVGGDDGADAGTGGGAGGGGEAGGAGGGDADAGDQPLPTPTLSQSTPLQPASVIVGSGAFELTVLGQGFVATSVVRVGGADRATTFVDATTLKAAIPATDVQALGELSVTVFTAATNGGGTSGAATLAVVNPAPTLDAATPLNPASAVAGSADFTLTVTGAGFQPTSVIRWGPADKTTTFVSATQLTALISAADILSGGTVQVTVFTPSPGGGTTIGATFTVNNPLPSVTSLTPDTVATSSSSVALTVRGSNFVASSQVQVNAVARSTTFVSSTELTAQLLPQDVATAGLVNITVTNPTPGGGTSTAAVLRVRDPLLTFDRASLATDGGQGNDISLNPSVSATGRYVAFASDSTNLVPGDTWGAVDVFLRDTCIGATGCTPSTVRISVAPDGGEGFSGSNYPSLTGDARAVAFVSDAPNLVMDDTNSQADVFMRELCTGVPSCTPVTVRASVSTAGVQGNDTSDTPVISANGRFVAFRSMSSNLVANDTNGARDVFVRDTCSGASSCTPSTVLVSVSTGGALGNQYSASERPAISANGRYVAFSSLASTLIASDGNAVSDVFLRDTCFNATNCTPSTIRVSVTNAGGEANSASTTADISADGRFVLFESRASNLVANDTNGTGDIFLRDTCIGAASGCTPSTERVSLTNLGAEANGMSYDPVMSPDARFIGWTTYASNLVSTTMGGVVRDTCRGATNCTPNTVYVTVAAPGGTNPSAFWGMLSLSHDGRIVAWTADQVGILPNDTNGRRDIFLTRTGY